MSNVKFYFGGITEKPSKDGTKILKFLTIHIQREGYTPSIFNGFASDEQVELCKGKAQFSECECLFIPNSKGEAVLAELSFATSSQGSKAKTADTDK